MNLKPNRYSKQILLNEFGIEGQKKFSEAKVLVIGCGGVGSPVLMYLAAAGVGCIGIMDYEDVELSNLHRQILFSESQIDFSKADSTYDNLRKLNSEIEYIVYDKYLNSKNGFEILSCFDIIVDATDNFISRYLINDLCVCLSKPYVMGSVNKFEGQVAVLNYNEGPTYRCFFPEFPESKLIKNCEDSGVIGSLCGIVGSVAATEVLKLIAAPEFSTSGELLFINSLKMEFSKICCKRNITSIENAHKLKEKLTNA